MKAYQKGSGSGEPIKNGNKSWTVRQKYTVRNVCMILWTESVHLTNFQETEVLPGDVFYHVGIQAESHLLI